MKTLFSLLLLTLLPLPARAAEIIRLPVPHLWEIPDGRWVPPWSGACEEASVSMVDQFYRGHKKLTFPPRAAKAIMFPLFGIENQLFGSNTDTNSTRTLKLINGYTKFDAVIKNNPTVEDIKQQLRAGHPVISLHRGYDLHNPLHRFRRGSSSYHMMVINGFDDAKQEFIVNDPELKNGLDFRYKYGTILASLHDFNHTTKKADGPPTVLFTRAKEKK